MQTSPDTYTTYGFKQFVSQLASRLKRNTWHRVTLGTRLNTFAANGSPRADGAMLVAVDDLVVTRSDIVWRADPAMQLRYFGIENYNNNSNQDTTTAAGAPARRARDRGTMYYKDFEMYRWA